METTQVNRKQIDDLRAWFFAKDRSISLAQNTLYYLFTNQANGAYMSMAFISETVLSASSASVTFSNIPQNFRNLMIFMRTRTDRAAQEADTTLMRYNGDSGSNYDNVSIRGNSATASSAVARGQAFVIVGISEAAASRAFNFAPAIVFIPGYSVAGSEKTAIAMLGSFGNLSADADLFVEIRAGHWRNTNVITSVTIFPVVGPNFVSDSRFQLYGIL